MPATLHIYVPLHFYSSLYIDPTSLHASITNQYTATIIYNTCAQYVPPINMPLKCNKYDIYPNYSMCICGKVCQYTFHKLVAPINDVARIAVQRRRRRHWPITYTE